LVSLATSSTQAATPWFKEARVKCCGAVAMRVPSGNTYRRRRMTDGGMRANCWRNNKFYK
jgi:hypothetical protein